MNSSNPQGLNSLFLLSDSLKTKLIKESVQSVIAAKNVKVSTPNYSCLTYLIVLLWEIEGSTKYNLLNVKQAIYYLVHLRNYCAVYTLGVFG